MNATLTIQVRILSRDALAQIGALQKQVNSLNAAGGASGAASAAGAMAAGSAWQRAGQKIKTAFGGAMQAFTEGNKVLKRTTTTLGTVGQSLRRSGQQIMFGFTLPVALAGTAMMGWALDNERAMTQVRKVYGDFSYTQERVKAETDELSKTFELLSSRLGVTQSEVIDIGAAWAGAGLAGRDLAEATKATLETMILGEMEAGKATEALISILATWRTSTEKDVNSVNGSFSELTDTLAILNAIENQTGARFGDLVDVLARAGGAARQAGIDVRTLAALGASLVPATGSGAAAGNALKTMISRIMAPTGETLEILNQIGIVTSDPKWMGATVMGKIEQMSEKFLELDQANRNVVTSLVAGRWQLNRFEVMMEDVASGNGFFQKALDATASATQRQGTYLRELNTVLDSNPKKVEILTNVLKNNLTKVMIQFIPVIIGVLGMLGKAAEAFNNLSPSTKAWIGAVIAAIAVLGPILMLLGVLVTTLKFVVEAFAFAWGAVKLFTFILGTLWRMSSFVITRALIPLGKAFFLHVVKPVAAATLAVAKYIGKMLLMTARWAAQTVIQLARIGIAWLAQAAGPMLIAVKSMLVQLGTMIARMALTAAGAVANAAIVGVAWLASAMPGVTAAVGGMLVGLASLVRGFGLAALAAARTAITTLVMWASVAAPGVVAAVGAIGSAVAAAAAFLGVSVGTMVAIIAAAVAVLAGIVLMVVNKGFRDRVIDAVQSVVDAVWALPRAFASALSSLLKVVAKIVMMIVDWLSYLNPFQRHSPSLVDNVRAGVATILDEYSSLKGISKHVLDAASAHLAFQRAIAGAQGGFRAQETAQQRQAVASAAPQALPAFDNMVAARTTLEQDLIPLTIEIDKQSRVVATLTAQYDQLEAQLRDEELVLKKLERSLKLVDDQISKSEDAIDRYASTGITGMRAMEDEIFANEMAQKRLQLAIMDLEDAGGAITDLQARMAELNGEMELLTGTRQGLYLGGAGSDILQVYDDQIALVREQQEALQDTSDSVSDLVDQLAALERAGQRLDLENSIKFDEQLRQIDQMVEGLNEMPFEDIIAAIEVENQKLATLRPIQEQLNAQVERQRAKVEAITYEHDILKSQLDAEAEKLAELEAAYSDIEQLISEMNSNMQEFASNAKAAKDALSGEGGKLDGLEGDYPVVTGTGSLDTNSTLAEIEAFNQEQQQLLEDMLNDIPDPFASFKEKWETFKGWFANNSFVDWVQRNFSWEGLGNFFGEIGGFFQRNLSLEGLKNIGAEILGFFWNLGASILNVLLWPFRQLANLLRPIWQPVWNVIATVFGVLVQVVTTVWNAIVAVISWAWNEVIYPVLMGLWNFFYTYIFPVFQLLWGIVQIAFMIVVRIIQGAVWVVMKILEGLWWVVTHVGDVFMWLWKNIVKPVWENIKGAISGAWNAIIKPVLTAIWSFLVAVLGPVFNWLWNSVIKPVWENIKGAISGAWNAIIKPIFEAMKSWVQDTLPKAWDGLKNVVTGVWDNIVRGSKNFANSVIDAINTVIGGFNKLAEGVKWVGDKLGISITINPIPTIQPMKLAKGGIPPVDADGGLYAGVRAIVGEGSRVWPEYVIPTDPRYRDRAKMLAQAAAQRVGLFAQGGTVGQGKEDGGGFLGGLSRLVNNLPGVDVVKDAARTAAKLAFAPIKALAMQMVSHIPSELMKGFIKKPIQMIEEWIGKSEPKVGGDRSTLENWKGRPGSYQAIIKYFQTTGVPGFAGSTIRPGATTRGSGNTRASLHASARAVDFFTIPQSIDSPGLLAIYRAFLPVRDLLAELIYSGPGGSNPKNPITAADHHNHVHVGLARGGMAQAQRIYEFANGGTFKIPHGDGGILARIGEGRNDERVQVIPLRDSQREGGGDTIIEINGDLSFPNITSGDDAEKLIENLKALAS